VEGQATVKTLEDTSNGTIVNEDTREPYESPRIEAEELYEVLALACGKVIPNQANCVRLANQS
jgi:hypothetical protein